jgi:hypothetical protein
MIADDVRNIINTIPRAYMRPMRNGSVLCGSYIGTPEAHAELQSALESAGFNCQPNPVGRPGTGAEHMLVVTKVPT